MSPFAPGWLDAACHRVKASDGSPSTFQQIAERAQVDPATFAHWRRARRRPSDVRPLRRLARVLGVPADLLEECAGLGRLQIPEPPEPVAQTTAPAVPKPARAPAPPMSAGAASLQTLPPSYSRLADEARRRSALPGYTSRYLTIEFDSELRELAAEARREGHLDVVAQCEAAILEFGSREKNREMRARKWCAECIRLLAAGMGPSRLPPYWRSFSERPRANAGPDPAWLAATVAAPGLGEAAGAEVRRRQTARWLSALRDDAQDVGESTLAQLCDQALSGDVDALAQCESARDRVISGLSPF